jgi:CBS domain-containing protein
MPVPVSDIMSPIEAVVGADTTLRQAAVKMGQYHTGAALVIDPTLPGPGIVTERDVLRALAEGADPDDARVADYMHSKLIAAAPAWPATQAAEAMMKHHIRHIVVFEEEHLVGILSMRDVIKVLGLSVAEDQAHN